MTWPKGYGPYMNDYGPTAHVTTVAITGCGWRARCVSRDCKWMGRVHLFFAPNSQVCAWFEATEEGRGHVAEERIKTLRARKT